MAVKPFLHKHYLLFDEYELLEERCDRCNEQIKGQALTCESCNFWLHESCAKQLLPSEISDPLNPEHTLRLECSYFYKHFMCSKCFRLSKGYGYSTPDDSFVLDVVCASSSTNWEVEEMDKRYKDEAGKASWYRFDGSPLSLVKYRKVRRYGYSCSWCDESLSDSIMSYISLESSRQTFFHEACLSKIPRKINFHPFHPYHPLYLESSYVYDRCFACGIHDDRSTVYCCGKCNLRIHILCSNLKPSLKHYASHHHPLTYFRKGDFECNICKLRPSQLNPNAFYRCVECDFNVDVECWIPSSVKHRYHRHSLTLARFFIEDGSAEPYCDICEQRRNLRNHVYYCKECTFTAHIECALSMVNDTRFDVGTTSMLMHEDEELGTNIKLMDNIRHPHPLNLKRIFEVPNYRKLECKACLWEICEEDEQVYVCEKSSCREDCYHKACAEMPIDLNLIHIHHHPLTLLWESYYNFICDICRDVSDTFKYVCFECSFKLDMKCAATALVASKTQHQVVERRHDHQLAAKLLHFSHPHELLFGYVRPDIHVRIFIRCRVCLLLISGSAYICFPCHYYVHQSCLLKLPSHIDIPFHPRHTLYPYSQTLLGEKTCVACNQSILEFGYRCWRCSIYFHYICTTSLSRSLTSQFHFHNLYYLPTSDMLAHDDGAPYELVSYICGICNESCEESLYRCIECDVNFHLSCIAVPDKVKCKRHIHDLILKDGFVEDDSGEYYCDICEKERYRNQEVYFCEECDGTFVAHIECALAEVTCDAPTRLGRIGF